MITEKIWDVFPTTFTILPTYRCNAECEQCCFESNPRMTHRLSLEQIKAVISEARADFPALRVIIFSGGECFLLKDDLYASIRHATDLGLLTRCVTNAFWGKTPDAAKRTVARLLDAGITEINISTGADHQKWVPLSSVENAAEALVEAGIQTLITIESDGPDSDCIRTAFESPTVRNLLATRSHLFRVQQNIWMPFNGKFDPGRVRDDNSGIYEGCDQLFSNIVATPYARLASCCGLTLEYIPELKLGTFTETGVKALALKQLDDALKLWLAVEGPGRIMQRLMGDGIAEKLRDVNHICHACVHMYRTEEVRQALRARIHEFLPEIVARFNLAITLKAVELERAQRPGLGRKPTQTTPPLEVGA